MWEGRYKSCVVDADNYLLICQRYIELNPVRAGMVDAPGDYNCLSYISNGLGNGSKLWSLHNNYLSLGRTVTDRASTYRKLFVGHLDSTNQGMALSNDKFKEEIEKISGRRVKSLKRGPKVAALIEQEFLL